MTTDERMADEEVNLSDKTLDLTTVIRKESAQWKSAFVSLPTNGIAKMVFSETSQSALGISFEPQRPAQNTVDHHADVQYAHGAVSRSSASLSMP